MVLIMDSVMASLKLLNIAVLLLNIAVLLLNIALVGTQVDQRHQGPINLQK